MSCFNPDFEHNIEGRYWSPSGSRLKRLWHLVPVNALALVADGLSAGQEKYGDDAWRNDPYLHHFDHAMEHLIASNGVTDGELQIEHVQHAAMRVLFMLELLTTSEA